MSYCINPNCPKPQNPKQPLFCHACGSELLLEGCYRVIRPLGGGGFGKTYEVEDSGTKKVLKVLFNTVPKAVELFQQEAEVLKRLNHPGIPKVESDGYFIYSPRDSKEPLHCLVMEKIEGMNLEEYMIQRNHQPIGERAAVRWLKQIVEILQQVHQQNYFHRDIKPPNIMLRPDGQLVLIDFGTAREVTQTFMQKVAGQQVTGIISAGYTPSEQVNGKAVPQSDFFALGRTFVYLLTGKSLDKFNEDARNGKLNWRNYAVGISPGLGDFIDYLMSPFPGNRPKDTQEILTCISVIDGSFKLENSGNEVPSSNHKTSNLNYGSFWLRLLAYCTDIFILTITISLWWKIFFNLFPLLPDYTINYVGAFGYSLIFTSLTTLGGVFGEIFATILFINSFNDPTEPLFAFIIPTFGFISKWLYFTWFESSHMQATLGKIIFGLNVKNISQKRLTFGEANVRFWSKSLSGLILLIGFIMAGFTEKRQGLHDKIAKTLVIKKPL
ncbi:RDD family protein [Sphaerospermopsis sp. LEGE 08334]|uniref:protein kinase domain-containing protein n=1 Tax=Sphaerospermopsis sp. LEGE 08334 TaxID=1828651 RepID=UPI0018820B85|nr:RDD family protein [Sphaerospermopsis sp. LEGE 08334]MBE9056055.1 RDD family protein [Sphaerospermopsis sp. LEGE 08334]